MPVFLSRLGQGGHLACSPEAMRLLMRMSWPGNAEQLHELLREVVKHRRTGCITPEDLPPEVHAVSRRVLSPLEAMERDAIVKCLADANGNKVQAAALARDVPSHDLPQDPRLRDRAADRLTARLTLRRAAPSTLRSVATVEATPSVAVPLLQLGLLLAVVLVGQRCRRTPDAAGDRSRDPAGPGARCATGCGRG